ncbi:hypothetical protein GIB67_008267 [Kingdonia uniflora]|uniref:Late embryogenesis abundant protein LEA-2 subgroup domain-containing protein n=1 Tax=Kingdonia uniflora TaxID=39325 RepID=A0A7J7N5E8_9MAGN|nr:hypothetical protein GIB67_008267 [Kingdonia uniflora]
MRKKKKVRCLVFTAIFTVIQIIVTLALTFTVMKVTSPKIRIEHFSIESSSFKNTSFDFTMNANVTIRNRNWGQYKYPNSTMVISYQGATVGEVEIPAGKAKSRRTRRVNVSVAVSSKGLSNNLPD